MFGKQLYISMLMGIVCGVFCAYGCMGLSFPRGELVETEAKQKLAVQTPAPVQIAALTGTIEKKVDKDYEEYNEYKKHDEYEEDEQIDEQIQEQIVPVPLEHGNKKLTNYNIMFFGIEDKKLQMLTVYSINQENNWKSGTVFIPTDTLVPGTRNQYIADYFYLYGAEKVKQLIENAMEININYYVMVDRNLLLEVEPHLDPIYVGGEKVNLSQIFTKEITPEDEIILASLLKNLTKPSIYFGVLPKLVLTCKQYIKTDFQLNWTNLWVHYQIAKNIDTSSVTKKIISGKYYTIRNQKYWVPTQHAWWNMVYEVTN